MTHLDDLIEAEHVQKELPDLFLLQTPTLVFVVMLPDLYKICTCHFTGPFCPRRAYVNGGAGFVMQMKSNWLHTAMVYILISWFPVGANRTFYCPIDRTFCCAEWNFHILHDSTFFHGRKIFIKRTSYCSNS